MSTSKWILGGLGFVMGGPIGALIGLVLASLWDGVSNVLTSGSTFDENAEQPTSEQRKTYTRRATIGDIRVSLVVLIACVMKADGQVMKSEVNSIKPFLLKNFGEEGAKDALQLLKELLDKEIEPTQVAQQIAAYVNYSTRLEIVHMLLDLAYADGEIVPAEEQVITRIVQSMGVQMADYHSLRALYRKQQDPNWAYTALEITPSATDEEVKKAYRRMAMKYHPDKVAAAGEEVQRSATEKFRAINEAYERIKTARGIN